MSLIMTILIGHFLNDQGLLMQYRRSKQCREVKSLPKLKNVIIQRMSMQAELDMGIKVCNLSEYYVIYFVIIIIIDELNLRYSAFSSLLHRLWPSSTISSINQKSSLRIPGNLKLHLVLVSMHIIILFAPLLHHQYMRIYFQNMRLLAAGDSSYFPSHYIDSFTETTWLIFLPYTRDTTAGKPIKLFYILGIWYHFSNCSAAWEYFASPKGEHYTYLNIFSHNIACILLLTDCHWCDCFTYCIQCKYFELSFFYSLQIVYFTNQTCHRDEPIKMRNTEFHASVLNLISIWPH